MLSSKIFRQVSFLALLTLSSTTSIAATEQGEALRSAARQGDLIQVKAMITSGTPVDTANRYGATALGYASDKGHLEIVRFLVANGADVNVEDTFYQATPLVWASYKSHTEVVVFLLENGATGIDQTLGIAISNKDLTLLDAILATKPSPEALGQALSKAHEMEGASEAISRLLAAGAKPPETSKVTVSQEVLARYVGSYSMVEDALLVDIVLKDEILIANFSGQSPLTLDPLDERTFRPRNGPPFQMQMAHGSPHSPSFDVLFDNGTERKFVRKEEVTYDSTKGDTKATDAKDEQSKETLAQTEPLLVVEGGETVTEMPPTSTDPLATTETIHWPAFRGANASGVASGYSLPVSWDSSSGEGLRWQLEIPGRAHASPIVWGKHLYLTTAVNEEGDGEFRHGLYGDVDPAGNDAVHSWRLYAIDRNTGKIEWHKQAQRGKPRADNHIKATQANASPATDGKRIVAILGSEGLFAWNLEGKLLWQVDLGLLDSGWFYDPTYQWGHSSSPVIHGDHVIVQVDRSADSYIAAFDLNDGTEAWRTTRDNLPSWGTPTLLHNGDNVEVITNGSHLARAYDPKTGEELWSLGPNSELTVGTPVIGHGMVYLTGGYPPVRPIYAVRPGGQGDLTLGDDTESSDFVAWSKNRGGTYIPTPLVYGDQFYTLANNGIFTCYDAHSGELLYRERIKARGGTAFSSSPVAGDGKIFLASEDGDVYVLKAGPEFEVLATNAMDQVIMATPAISEGTLYIRTLGKLYAVEGSKLNQSSATSSAQSTEKR